MKNTQICKYTIGVTITKLLKRPNMCYVFEKMVVQVDIAIREAIL